MVEDGDPVADALDVREDVGGEQDRRIAPERGDQLEGSPTALWIERADGLVEDDDRRPMDERTGDPQPLAHAARVRAGPSVRGIGKVHAGQGVVNGPGKRRPVQPV